MKLANILTILCLTFTSSAFASVDNFEKILGDTKLAESVFESQREVCDVHVNETSDGLTISVQEGNDHIVHISINSNSAIKLIEGEEESLDGSFRRKYIIKDEGSFEFTHMSDAYDHFYIVKNGNKTSCELDY